MSKTPKRNPGDGRPAKRFKPNAQVRKNDREVRGGSRRTTQEHDKGRRPPGRSQDEQGWRRRP